MPTPQPDYKGMSQLSDSDIQRLALDPHNLVYAPKQKEDVAETDRISGSDMKELVTTLRQDFLQAYALEVEKNKLRQNPGSSEFVITPKDNFQKTPKQMKSAVRREIVKDSQVLQKFWQLHPKVFCKATSPSTTDDQFDLILQMFDIRINEQQGKYGSKEATDNIIQQLLMGNLARPSDKE